MPEMEFLIPYGIPAVIIARLGKWPDIIGITLHRPPFFIFAYPGEQYPRDKITGC